MFSVNVPLPSAIGRLATDLQPKLSGFDRVRDRHTLVCKRIGAGAPKGSDPDRRGADGYGPGERKADGWKRERALERVRETVRPVLADTDPFRASVTGIGSFGGGGADDEPIVYLAVESPALVRLHRRLCRVVDPVEGIEGDDYVPHVTLARGGGTDRRQPDPLLEGGIEPIAWRVHALDLYDAEFREVAGTVDL